PNSRGDCEPSIREVRHLAKSQLLVDRSGDLKNRVLELGPFQNVELVPSLGGRAEGSDPAAEVHLDEELVDGVRGQGLGNEPQTFDSFDATYAVAAVADDRLVAPVLGLKAVGGCDPRENGPSGTRRSQIRGDVLG